MENNSNPTTNTVIRVDGNVRPRSDSDVTVATVLDNSPQSSQLSSFSSSSESQITQTASVENNNNESLQNPVSIVHASNATALLSPQQTQHQK